MDGGGIDVWTGKSDFWSPMSAFIQRRIPSVPK